MKLNKILVASTLSLGIATSANADFVLDTFQYVNVDGTVRADYGQSGTEDRFTLPWVEYSIIGGSIVGTDVYSEGPLLLETSYALGGTATYTFADAFGSPVDPTDAVDSEVISGDGVLKYYSGTSDGLSQLEIKYESTVPLPFSSFGDYFYVDVIKFNAGTDEFNNPVGFDVDVTVSYAGQTSSWSDSFSAFDVSSPLLIAFDEFTGDLANFDLVSSAVITFTNLGLGADFELNEFGIVSAPATLGLLGLSLMGLGMSRRRKSAK